MLSRPSYHRSPAWPSFDYCLLINKLIGMNFTFICWFLRDQHTVFADCKAINYWQSSQPDFLIFSKLNSYSRTFIANRQQYPIITHRLFRKRRRRQVTKRLMFEISPERITRDRLKHKRETRTIIFYQWTIISRRICERPKKWRNFLKITKKLRKYREKR